MLAECVERELPSEERAMEILVCSGEKKHNKIDKWEEGSLVFQ